MSSEPYFLIYGPSKSGKTSILFQQALITTLSNKEALYISNKPINELPLLPPNCSPQPSQLNLMQLRYPSTLDKAVKLLAEVHETNLRPGIILLDNFSAYVQTNNELQTANMAKLASLLRDASNFWTIRAKRSSPIPIIAATDYYHHSMCKWFPHLIKITQEDEKCFRLDLETPVVSSCSYSFLNGACQVLPEKCVINTCSSEF